MYFYAARQPILDRDKKLIGYELLFRDGVDNVKIHKQFRKSNLISYCNNIWQKTQNSITYIC